MNVPWETLEHAIFCRKPEVQLLEDWVATASADDEGVYRIDWREPGKPGVRHVCLSSRGGKVLQKSGRKPDKRTTSELGEAMVSLVEGADPEAQKAAQRIVVQTLSGIVTGSNRSQQLKAIELALSMIGTPEGPGWDGQGTCPIEAGEQACGVCGEIHVPVIIKADTVRELAGSLRTLDELLDKQ